MKKTYLQPSTETVVIATTTMNCDSNDINSDMGIGYGGIDDEGNKEPYSRLHLNIWEDNENGK